MNSLILRSPILGEEVPLLDIVQLAYLQSDRKKRQNEIQFINPDDPEFRFRDRSRPNPVTFQWEFTADVPENMILCLAETEDFSDCLKIPVHCAKPDDDFTKEDGFRFYGRLDLYNLVPGRTYFWKVISGKEFSSETGFFRTMKLPPRLILLPDAVNVRDIGGWQTASGSRVQYGKFFRGSAWTGLFSLTKRGKSILKGELKIRTELDLRGTEDFLSLPGVKHAAIPLGSYGCWGGNGKGIFDGEQQEHLRQIFDLLSIPENLPVYCHCAGGSDRTGTLTLLLEAVLGMSDEDILTDYEVTTLSCLGERSRNSTSFRTLLSGLSQFGGNTLSENSLTFLKTCRVTEEMIRSIRNNFLD